MASRKGGGGQKGITYTKPEEPAFLKAIKERVGYREPDTIDAKKKHIYAAENEDEEKDELLGGVRPEDRPQVVVLKEGDLSEADVDQIHKEQKEAEERAKIEAGDITFRKPIKRTHETSDASANSKETKNSGSDCVNSKMDRFENWQKKPKTESRLLSFQEDEGGDSG